MRHPSIPLAERAAHKCERPVLSSTLQSRRVSPSGSRTAPALKTLLTGYGQSSARRIGLFGLRVNRERLVDDSRFKDSVAANSGEVTGKVLRLKGKRSFLDEVHRR